MGIAKRGICVQDSTLPSGRCEKRCHQGKCHFDFWLNAESNTLEVKMIHLTILSFSCRCKLLSQQMFYCLVQTHLKCPDWWNFHSFPWEPTPSSDSSVGQVTFPVVPCLPPFLFFFFPAFLKKKFIFLNYESKYDNMLTGAHVFLLYFLLLDFFWQNDSPAPVEFSYSSFCDTSFGHYLYHHICHSFSFFPYPSVLLQTLLMNTAFPQYEFLKTLKPSASFMNYYIIGKIFS